MSNLPDNKKFNRSEIFGLDTDQRMVEVQNLAARRVYLVLSVQMILLGSYLFFGQGQTLAGISLVVVFLSILFLWWQRHRLGDGGSLDERTQPMFNHQFRYMNIALYLVCLLLPFFSRSYLWFALFILPVMVILGTLFFHRVNSWRLWLLWFAVSLLTGTTLGLAIVLSTTTFRFGWVVIACLAILSGWLGYATYRQQRSM